MTLKCDAVFQGGGVRGIAFVGAVSALQKRGYEFENLAGTSAGAIVAALLAAGYTADELEEELQKVDYLKFKEKDFLDKLGLLGESLSLVFEYGIYEGDYFENWLDGLLKAKGITTFGQIKIENPSDEKYIYKFQAIASDLTRNRMLVLPNDLKLCFGIDPDTFSISRAVRMSMSIPIFFEPVKLEDKKGKVHYIVDGGMLSNYPIWLLDDGTSNPPWPTFGFKLTDSGEQETDAGKPIHNILQYLIATISTMMRASDNYHISVSRGDKDRTMIIPTTVEVDGRKKKIRTTDFDLTHKESKELFNNGLETAEKFLLSWDFAAWKKKYREK